MSLISTCSLCNKVSYGMLCGFYYNQFIDYGIHVKIALDYSLKQPIEMYDVQLQLPSGIIMDFVNLCILKRIFL